MSRHDTFCDVGQDGSWGQVSCDCDYIKDIREDERERIIEMLESNHMPNLGNILHNVGGNCPACWTIELIKGEQK